MSAVEFLIKQRRHVAYYGNPDDAPIYLQNVVRSDIENGMSDNFIIIIDNWK